MSKDLNHIVQAAFENGKGDSAPESIWSAVNNELAQNSVDAQVKASFESLAGTAPEMVWERVQDRLDIDRVWKRIADKIQIKQFGYILRYACAILLFILPFSLDSDRLESHSRENYSSAFVASTANQVTPSNLDERSNGTLPENTTESAEVNNGNQFNLNNQLQDLQAGNSNQGQLGTIDPTKNEPTRNEETSAHTNKVGFLPVRALLAVSPEVSAVHQTFDIKKPKRKLGLTIGAVGSLNNTWIVDNETRSGFDSESLIQNKISIGSSYGAFAEYAINPQFSISAEYLVQSRSNQNTHFYDNGVYSLREREINAYKVALMGSLNTRPKFHGVAHTNLIRFGPYMSGVKNDYTKINGVLTKVNTVNERYDVGLRLDLGKKFYWQSFSIEGGIKSEFGLMNLAAQNTKIPPHLNFTRLVSVGSYLRIGYTF